MNEALTPAAQVILSIVPIVGIAFAAIIVFFALLWRHREIKARIRTEQYIPPVYDWQAFSLLIGLCLCGVGLVLTVMFILLNGFTWTLLGGLIPLVLGLAVLIFYKLNPSFHKTVGNEK